MNIITSQFFYKKITVLFVGFLLIIVSVRAAIIPTNFTLPYQRVFSNEIWQDSAVKLGFFLEDSFVGYGRNSCQDKVSVLRLHTTTESSIAMLMGAKEGSEIHQLAGSLLSSLGSVTDDGVRGHFLLDGSIDHTLLTIFVRYRLCTLFDGDLEFGAYLPVRRISIRDVVLQDLTQDKLYADLAIKRVLTNSLVQKAQELGSLHIGNWSDQDIGDFSFLARWQRDFNQEHKDLYNVRLALSTGLIIPTGKCKDPDEAFSLPFGNDGAWAIPLGFAIDLDFTRYVRGGIDINLLALFDQEHVRRLKTDEHQTDYFLLHKGKATKSHGLFWKFTLYTQMQEIIKNLSAMIGYQFTKHEPDTLYSQSNKFIHQVVNTADHLKEWNIHNLLFQVNVDTASFSSWPIKPQISIFSKLAITGRRAIASNTFGAQLVFSF